MVDIFSKWLKRIARQLAHERVIIHELEKIIIHIPKNWESRDILEKAIAELEILDIKNNGPLAQ